MTSSRRASAIALALFVAAAASGLAAEAERAVLVSVPGLSAPELEALWRAGALDGGGFAPFFEVFRALLELRPETVADDRLGGGPHEQQDRGTAASAVTIDAVGGEVRKQ